MINSECPYCRNEISPELNHIRKDKKGTYWAGFLVCKNCNKDYRVILIEDFYTQIEGFNKVSYDKMMALNKVLIDKFQNNETTATPPKKYKTWVNCVSDDNMNEHFSSKKVVAHEVECAADAISEAISDAAIRIFKQQPKLESVKLMCYYITAAWTTALEIHTIYNTPTTISVENPNIPTWNRKSTSSISWDEDEFCIDVPALETPFPYEDETLKFYEA